VSRLTLENDENEDFDHGSKSEEGGDGEPGGDARGDNADCKSPALRRTYQTRTEHSRRHDSSNIGNQNCAYMAGALKENLFLPLTVENVMKQPIASFKKVF